MSAAVTWCAPAEMPKAGARVRRKRDALTGRVGPYGWIGTDGTWRHGTIFPVRWAGGMWSLARLEDVEVPRHLPCDEHNGQHCELCEMPWPCPGAPAADT